MKKIHSLYILFLAYLVFSSFLQSISALSSKVINTKFVQQLDKYHSICQSYLLATPEVITPWVLSPTALQSFLSKPVIGYHPFQRPNLPQSSLFLSSKSNVPFVDSDLTQLICVFSSTPNSIPTTSLPNSFHLKAHRILSIVFRSSPKERFFLYSCPSCNSVTTVYLSIYRTSPHRLLSLLPKTSLKKDQFTLFPPYFLCPDQLISSTCL
jgi:hypothetical protein